jgi:hypothetical protein
MTHTYKAGDAVTWTVYGKEKRGTIVETPNGSVAIIRDHATWSRTWSHLDSLKLVDGAA